MADIADLDEPVDELEYWEDDELTAEELMAGEYTRWSGCPIGQAREAAGTYAADERSVVDAAGPAGHPGSEGSVPDLVAAVLAASGDPALMTDADLVRSLAAWHAVGSRAAGREMRATEELLRRRRPRVWDRRADRAAEVREDRDGAVSDGAVSDGGVPERVMPAVVFSREAAAEIALALTSTEYAATTQAELAETLSRRLPRAFGELDAGRTDLYRVRLLADATQVLSDEDAGAVDALLAPSLGRMTTGDLRDRARKAIAAIDAKAADRRRERAQRKARFALYGNEDLTATAAVERMPAHLGAAVKARVNAIARAAKAAGMGGPMHLLEAKVATGLLLGTLPWIGPPADGGPDSGSPDSGGPDSDSLDSDSLDSGGLDSGSPDNDGPDNDGPDGGPAYGDADDPEAAGDPWDGGWPRDWSTGPAAPRGDEASTSDSEFAPADPDATDRGQSGAGASDTGRANADVPDPGPADAVAPERGPEDAGVAGFGSGDPERGGACGGAVVAGIGVMAWPRIPAHAGAAAPGCLGVPGWLWPKEPGRIRLLVPWRSLAGIGQEPAELSWIGPITPGQARELAAAAAADRACAWRLIVTDEEGRAIAITTLRDRRETGAGSPGLVSEVTVTISAALAAGFGRGGRGCWGAQLHAGGPVCGDAGYRGDPAAGDPATGSPGGGKLDELLVRAIGAANLAAAEAADRRAADREAGGCAHTMETTGYRVGGRLRRWLNVRDRTCRNPICRQPATRCDQDHTTAYHRGGRSCSCNLGGVCRAHHELKQLPGWRLSQDAGTTFTWRTPAGLSYRKESHRYAV